MEFHRQANVIHTGRDGRLATTTPADLAAIAAAICRSERVVLHFHGGLVSEDAGFETAERLFGTYHGAGALPVFFVWRSGVREIVGDNLRAIVQEEIFNRLLRTVLRYAVGKVRQTDGQRAAGMVPAADEMSVNRELKRRDEDEEPYDKLDPPPGAEPLGTVERAQFETEIVEDAAIQDELAAILAWHTGTNGAGARGVYEATPKPSLISGEVLDDLAAADEGARGIVGTIALAKKVADAVVNVIDRFRAGTGHGIYATVVEELLRALYLGNVGGVLWAAMKRETQATFGGDGAGGRLLDAITDGLAANPGSRPEITLVGHSTGAVFIDNLLTAVHGRRAAFPRDFAFRNVVFLAPACTYDHFGAALDAGDLIGRFRMFTMTDEAERADHLVRGVYPRSLLYLVAGLLERDDGDRSAYRPIAGMARYLDGAGGGGGVARVRGFLTGDPSRLVRSPSSAGAGPGLRSTARSHGDFDEDKLVLDSLGVLIRGDDRPYAPGEGR